jgi:penicillin amidase
MRYLKHIYPLFAGLLLFVLLNRKWGPVPPLGTFLSPFTGYWQNTERLQKGETALHIKGLKDQVTVLYDGNHVPHIFARNDHDLFLAQGYITATDRLWQMEFQTRAAAGRISEVVGSAALRLDQYQRRMGMVYGAENSLKEMFRDPQTRVMLEAYTDGVNAYISQLTSRDYPLEYKLLDYAPEPWTVLKCALLLKQMTSTLNGGSNDLKMTNILHQYGAVLTEALFPNQSSAADAIIPQHTAWSFTPLKLPPADSMTTDATIAGISHRAPQEGIGSNNWALSGTRTASGAPILANDPHLNLTLPAIWYQVQLHAPGVNVCGVSMPGVPCVVIGFNNRVAWGVTNTGADVLDFYNIQFKNSDKKEYLLDDAWQPVHQRMERIRVRGQQDVVDTVAYTRFGPVVYETGMTPFKDEVPAGYACKWIAHYGGNEMKTFYLLNRASDYTSFVKALSYYVAPAQNFIFASAANDIAIWVNGKFPLKWNGQGKYLLNGSHTGNDWQGWIPFDQNPHVRNPDRGFVSSANQVPADSTYPYYLHWQFSLSDRASRINELLGNMHHASIDSIRLMQLDSYKKLAEWSLPLMLHFTDTAALDATARKAFAALKSWDLQDSRHAIAPGIFEAWWSEFEYDVWDDEFPENGPQSMMHPYYDQTIRLLRTDTASAWFDNIKTGEKENIRSVATNSFQRTIKHMQERYGNPGPSWEWAAVKGTKVNHLLNVPGLGTGALPMGGGKRTINAVGSGSGPSWRMIVELTQPVKAYGIYPGGQSGNPGSPYYDNMIGKWRDGDLNKLVFLQSPADGGADITGKLVLEARR